MGTLPGVYEAKKKDGSLYYRTSITYHSKVIIRKKQRMQLTGKPENFLTLTLYIHLTTTILTIFRIFLIRNGSV